MKKRNLQSNKVLYVSSVLTDCQCSIFNKSSKINQNCMQNRIIQNKNEIQISDINHFTNSVDRKKKISVTELVKRKSRENSLKLQEKSKLSQQQQVQSFKFLSSKNFLDYGSVNEKKNTKNEQKIIYKDLTRIASIKPAEKVFLSTPSISIDSKKNFQKTENYIPVNNIKPIEISYQKNKNLLVNYMSQSSNPEILINNKREIPIQNIPTGIQLLNKIPAQFTFGTNSSKNDKSYQMNLRETQSIYDGNEQIPLKKSQYMETLEMETRLNCKKIKSIADSQYVEQPNFQSFINPSNRIRQLFSNRSKMINQQQYNYYAQKNVFQSQIK